MALRAIDGALRWAIDDATGFLHIIQQDGSDALGGPIDFDITGGGGIATVEKIHSISTPAEWKTAVDDVIANPRKFINTFKVSADLALTGSHTSTGTVRAIINVIADQKTSATRPKITDTGYKMDVGDATIIWNGVDYKSDTGDANDFINTTGDESFVFDGYNSDFESLNNRALVMGKNDNYTTVGMTNCTGTITNTSIGIFATSNNGFGTEKEIMDVTLTGCRFSGLLASAADTVEELNITLISTLITNNGNGVWNETNSGVLIVDYTPDSNVDQTLVGGSSAVTFTELFKIPGSQVEIPQSTGLLSGGVLSIGTDTAKFDMTAMVGLVVDNYTDPENPVFTPVSIPDQDEVTVTDLATQGRTFISVDSTGAIVQRSVEATPTQIRDEIVVGILVHPDNLAIDATIDRPITMVDPDLGNVDLARVIGTINLNGGNIISANGANLNINTNAGQQFRIGSNFGTSRQNPNISTQSSDTALTFRYRHQDGSGGFDQLSDTIAIDPDQYDNGTGTLAAVANNKFTIQKAFMFSTGAVRIQYGQNIYDSLADAEAAVVGEVFNADPNLLENSAFRASIIVKKGAADLSDAALAKFLSAGKFGISGSSGLTFSTTSLQGAYENSTVPQITTDATNGALQIKRGSAADTDDVFEILNGAGTQVLALKGDGKTPGFPEAIAINVSAIDIDATTGLLKASFRIPFAMTLTQVRASAGIAPVGSTMIIDIEDSGTSIMTTNKLDILTTATIDDETATLTDTALAQWALVTCSIDAVGSSTAGQEIIVYLVGTRT